MNYNQWNHILIFHFVLERCYMWGFKNRAKDGWILNVLMNLVNFILLIDGIIFSGGIEWFNLCCYIRILCKCFR